LLFHSTICIRELLAAQVTTLLSRLDNAADAANLRATAEDLKQAVTEQGPKVSSAKAKAKQSGTHDDSAAAKAEVNTLLQLKERLDTAQRALERGCVPVKDSGAVDYAQDFFGRRAYLTVSGQLNGGICLNKKNALRHWLLQTAIPFS
jgi:hypothetical protein